MVTSRLGLKKELSTLANSGVKELKKGDILFREGDASDAMYVIKKGRIAITKAKGSKEIVLAELVAGEMLGEMAFFDDKPRSAGAKASVDAEVIALPFVALHAQFKTFPEWLKAMVKTVNSHLRNANSRIKNLEQATTEEKEMFPPHMITKLIAIISLIGMKCGEPVEGTEGHMVIPYSVLRNYCIQVFGAPTNKLDKIMEVLESKGYMQVEDIGEGKKRVTCKDHEFLTKFVDWYNKYLFTEDSKRTTVDEKELLPMRALVHFAAKTQAAENGDITINLTEIQNESMKELNQLVEVFVFDSLAEKGLIGERVSAEGGKLTTTFKLDNITTIYPFWDLVYTLLKVPSNR
ncbi:MAG: Crp/Fnr family transcriptional regulator [Bdellovibrionales bacterium]|nr:Crp/Fnr family transcriptional regulator [Bdellovibrionales bacterium]